MSLKLSTEKSCLVFPLYLVITVIPGVHVAGDKRVSASSYAFFRTVGYLDRSDRSSVWRRAADIQSQFISMKTEPRRLCCVVLYC